MAAPSSASLLNSLSSLSLSLSSSEAPPATVSLSSVFASSKSSSMQALKLSQPLTAPVIRETSHDLQSVLFPSLAFSNTLFFKRPYNVQVIVGPDESEESLIGRFRREVFRANVIHECKRRRFFETNQEKRKRITRDAARRRSRRHQRPVAKKDDTPQKKLIDNEPDNWDLIDIEVPYCQ